MGLTETVADVLDPLAADAATCDDLGRLSDDSWALLHRSGVLRSLQPARFGGAEVSMPEFLDAIVALARATPSAGWVAGVIGVHPWQLALFDDRAQQEMWADDPTRMHSSSYNPTGRATAVDGGYEVSGRWSFSSGSHHCEGVNLGVVTTRADGGRELRSVLLRRDQYEIDECWDVAGLRGTGSDDIVVERAFVPDHRTQSHLDYGGTSRLPGWEFNDAAVFRIPWSVMFNAALAASILGAAKGYLDVWIDEAKGRGRPGSGGLANDPLSQRRVAEASWILEAAIEGLRADAAELQGRAEVGDMPSMADRGRYRWRLNRGCELVAASIGDLHRAGSGRSIFRDHPLHSRFHDVQAGLGHAFLTTDSVARSAGGSLLGTDDPEMIL